MTSRMIANPAASRPAAAGSGAAAAPAVRVSGMRKRYGPVAALNGVDLDIEAGEFFTLLGPSGSGRSPGSSIPTAGGSSWAAGT